MNEDQLVAAIAALTRRASSRIRVGIGDDAAVWQPSRSHRSVITTDALVEGVHFSLQWMSAADAGWRAMAANASDIAAMGARPLLATIALGVPAGADEETILAWYRGLDGCARETGIEICGGDITRAPVWMISITAVGEVSPTHLKLRSQARPGDAIVATGPLGASRAGLMQLSGGISLEPPLASAAVEAHRRPRARVDEGRWLGASRYVRAMIDCSDGLSTDLLRLLRASGCGARIEAVPIADAARAAAVALGEEPERFALAGGEDFELIATVAAHAFPHLSRRFRARFGRELSRVGTVRADARISLAKDGVEESIGSTGWDHFT